jgi:hypothetical protein
MRVAPRRRPPQRPPRQCVRPAPMTQAPLRGFSPDPIGHDARPTDHRPTEFPLVLR